MKPQELSDAMQFLDDSTLTETANALKKRPLRARWFALTAAAACVCIAALLFVPILEGQLPSSLPGPDSASGAHGEGDPQGENAPSPASGANGAGGPDGENTPSPTPGTAGGAPPREDLDPAYLASVLNGEIPAHGEVDPSLPTITLDAEHFAGGMGYEGYLAYDVSELENGGPWRPGDAIDTLPVYRNPLWKDHFEVVRNADFDAMRACLLDLIARLGYDEAQFAISTDAPDEARQESIRQKFASVGEEVPDGYFQPRYLIAEADGVKLEIDASMIASIHFDPALPLPEDYDLSWHAARGDVEAAGTYLLEQYRTLIGYETPVAAISEGDRNIYGEQSYTLHFYDASEDPVRNLENYWLDYWNFYGGEEAGEFYLARHWYRDRSEKLGDYPIITPAEGWQMLQNGNYLTTVPVPVPEDAFPARVDLLYRNGSGEQVFLPYYRFLIELPDGERDGMKDYGAYYVPAVQSEYLDGLPLWDGRFN